MHDGGSGLSPEQRRILAEWFPRHRVLADHSWGLVGTFVLEVDTGSGRVIVKAGDEHDHHLGREVRAHREWLTPWTSIGRAPALLRADERARIIATRYLPGRLVQGAPEELEPDVFRQAGALLALLHGQRTVIDHDYARILRDEVLSRFEQPHRMSAATVRAARAEVEAWSTDPVEVVPTHGDWQPRNWLLHEGEVAVIDFGRAELRPALSDLVRLESRSFRHAPALEAAFLEGYGADPRDSPWWRRERLRAAIGTAVWALAVGDAEFEAEGRREAAALLGTSEA
ncbi:phosphotransferase family protein [Amnibacterium kyonggiense]|uniref:Phosphotransferase family enzyme n=1 Tax=Amnibacterium kyonggiense TaxID=595671 RepID=A0A4R7FJ02_9MICO|nr:phosphotransferase [Amnibacterium kyonggiense]TDS75072.1 phosphotransferase family enzyme [Amnibacterium kyonggiense]